MPEENIVGPTVTWNELEGKDVKSNDGKKLGKIKDVSQYHLRIKKGTIKKRSFWLPKYLADTYDGKDLWLNSDEKDIHNAFFYVEEPPASGDGASAVNVEGVGVVDKRMTGIPTNASGDSRYKNIRDLDSSNNEK